MIYFLSVWDKIKDSAVGVVIRSGARSLFYSINSYIYKLIIELYDVFMALCHGKLLDSNALNALFGRIGVILGLVMFMYVAFSFVKVLIDPDSFNDKQKGIPNIIKKIIIVIVMLGISSYVFTLLNNIQSAIIKNNVISKLIMPSNIKTDDFGSLLSSQLFLSFYSFKDDVEANDDDDISKWCKEDNNAVVKLRESIVNNQNFDIGLDCLNAYGKVSNYVGEGDKDDFLIDYNFIFCLIVGVIVCYLLLTYCISVGIRMVQLAVLQIISPMAIVSYLSPKQDNMFSKWTKIYISTYIDVFIRIAIINFVVYLSGFVLDSWTNRDNVFWTSVGGNAGFKSYVIGILMILALLSFAKKAPELIKQLIPQAASGIGFGLGNEGAKAFIGAGVGATVGAIGGVAGGKGVIGKATGLLGGIGFGALRGGKSGFGAKGLGSAISGSASAQSKANLARAQSISSGIGLGGRIGNTVRGTLGIETGFSTDDRDINVLNTYAGIQDNIESYAENQKFIKNLKKNYEALKSSGASVEEIRNAESIYKGARDKFIDNALKGFELKTGDYQFEYKDYNGNVQTSSFHVDAAKDELIYRDIRTSQSMLNEMLGKNKNVFGREYSKVTSQESMDNNSIRAKSDIVTANSRKRSNPGKK